MKESFEEYKEVIDQNLQQFSFIYSGDAKTSTEYSISRIIENPKVSPKFIIDAIDEIYHKSINRMIEKSIDLKSLHTKEINRDIFYSTLNGLVTKMNTKFVFSSSIIMNYHLINKNTSPFPDYFNKLSRSNVYNVYWSPDIENTNDEVIVYLVDGGIQSLVYIIQNMSYEINGDLHTINYPLYECSYISYKIRLVNIRKIRDEKIDSILN